MRNVGGRKIVIPTIPQSARRDVMRKRFFRFLFNIVLLV